MKKWTYFVCQRRIINGSDKRGLFILTYSSLAKRFRIRAVSDLFIVLQRLVLYIEYNWGVAILLRYWRIGTNFLRIIVSLIFSFLYFHNIESKNWSKINRATRIFIMNRRNLPTVVRFFVIIIVVIKVYRLF